MDGHPVLQLGSRGSEVASWQSFLNAHEFWAGKADGLFGDRTRSATMRFQRSNHLSADGVVGPRTLAEARSQGYPSTDASPGEEYWPAEPAFPPLRTTAQRSALFGHYEFDPAPTADNPEAIRIHGSWEKDNLVTIEVPELCGVPYGWGGVSSGRLRVHRRCAEQVRALWRAWATEDLLSLVLTYDGDYAPRLIRGSTATLSAHAFGSAFDINAQHNPIGQKPVRFGEKGSVLELVAVAHRYGFYWGGHFKSRPDGMHFEVATLV